VPIFADAFENRRGESNQGFETLLLGQEARHTFVITLKPSSTTRSLAIAIAFTCVLLGLFVRDHFGSLYDDAFIYLRYVKNLRAGCGLRFNCSDAPVEAFTGPLYLAILSLGGVFTRKLVTLTQVVGALALAGALLTALVAAARPIETATTTATATRDGSTHPAARSVIIGAVALLLALDHYVLLNSVIGLETSLAALVVTAAWSAADSARPKTLATLAVVAFSVRPEAVLLCALLPVVRATRSARILGAVFAALVVITAARWSIFHDILPNTYFAKSGGTWRHASLGLAYIVDALRDFPVIALSPLALLSLTARARRDATAYALLVTLAWLAFFLRSGGDTFEYSRLAFPLVPMLTVLAVRGVYGVAARALAARPRVAMVCVAGVALLIGGRAAYAHRLPTQHGFDNVQRWTRVGKYFAERAPHATLATVPVGAISYFSGLRVIDLVGLGSREIAHAGRTVPPDLLVKRWLGHERHDTEWVLAQRPDYVVTTKVRAAPWRDLSEAEAGFYADWLILRAMKSGSAPYHVADAEIAPGVHWLVFARDDAKELTGSAATPRPESAAGRE
jgi:arabinofuranosyltransferase